LINRLINVPAMKQLCLHFFTTTEHFYCHYHLLYLMLKHGEKM